MDKFLGIDYGLKRVGIAITDPLKIISSPLTTIPTENIFSFLEKIITIDNISTIVVGLPLNLNLSPTHSTSLTVKFIENLKIKFPNIKIICFDERYTSKIASLSIQSLSLNKKKRENKSIIDRISASLILQSYIESENKKKFDY